MADTTEAAKILFTKLDEEEGNRLKPYLCPAGVPTIGRGCTTYLDGRKVKLSDPPITAEQSDRMHEVNIGRYIEAVMEMVEGHCTTNQLVALVLCGYNIGLGALKGSSMIKLHRAGKYGAAASFFPKWDKYRPTPESPLIVHPVLHARRLREAAIYATPDPESPQAAMPAPQAVAPESSLATSPTMVSGTTMTAGGALTIFGSVSDAFSGMAKWAKEVAGNMDVTPVQALAGAMVIVGVIVVYRRWKQRQEGLA